MTLRKSIIATTHIDSQNTRITREALEDAVEQINAGNKPLLLLEHNSTLPPHGKVVSAYVDKREDGEYQLVSEADIFEKTEELLFEDGTVLLRQESEIDSTPFSNRHSEYTNSEYEITVDSTNLENYKMIDALATEIRTEAEVEFEISEFSRKAAVPDPEFFIKKFQKQ